MDLDLLFQYAFDDRNDAFDRIAALLIIGDDFKVKLSDRRVTILMRNLLEEGFSRSEGTQSIVLAYQLQSHLEEIAPSLIPRIDVQSEPSRPNVDSSPFDPENPTSTHAALVNSVFEDLINGRLALHYFSGIPTQVIAFLLTIPEIHHFLFGEIKKF